MNSCCDPPAVTIKPMRSRPIFAFILFVLLSMSCAGERPAPKIELPPGISLHLPKSDSAGSFFWDRFGGTTNPLTEKAIVVNNWEQIRIQGWLLNSQHTSLAGGVELAIDGKPFQLPYGVSRQDVADAFNNTALTKCGFDTSISAASLGQPGIHRIALRILSPDGQTYTESPQLTITNQRS